MKTTVWKKDKVVIYIGGDPTKGQVPDITLELNNPQIQLDTEKNHIIIVETN